MDINYVVERLSPEERKMLAVGAGVKSPQKRRELWGGGLINLAMEGRRLVELCDGMSIKSLMELGKLYLADLGLNMEE